MRPCRAGGSCAAIPSAASAASSEIRVTDTRPGLTYVGGPTFILEWHGLRLLTDPTFDPAGTAYELPGYALHKSQAPALAAGDVGHIDVVLLSDDHHLDNVDHAGSGSAQASPTGKRRSSARPTAHRCG